MSAGSSPQRQPAENPGSYALEPDAPTQVPVARQRQSPTASGPPRAISQRPGIGKHAQATAVSNPSCPNCGYSIVGLTGTTCPECGKRLPSILSIARRAEAKVALRREYRSALIALAVSWLVMGLLVGFTEGPLVVIGYYVYSVVMVGTGFAAFMACSMMWIGFDQPLGITVLRLAAIYAIVDAVLYGFELIPGVGAFTLLAWLLALGLYVSLMTKWLDLETKDAVAVAIVTQFIRFGLGIVLAFLL